MARSHLANAAVAMAAVGLLVPGLASPDAEERGHGGRDPRVSEAQLLPLLATALAVVAAIYVLASRAWDTRQQAAGHSP